MKAKIRFIAVFAALLLSAVAATGAAVVSESALASNGVQKSEVSMGDLFADAVRASLNTDFAFVSASEIKEKDGQIARGTVSSEDVAAYVAYADDPLVVMRLTGRQIRQALERSVLIYPKNNLGFLQISGLRFSFDASGPQESRVASILVGEKGNKPLQDSATYSVGMTSSMANGALGYWKIWSKNDRQTSTQTTIPDAIESFFRAKSSIDYSNLNRITVEK